MTADDFLQAQRDFASIDLRLLHKAYDELAVDKDAAASFATDPDVYMKERLGEHLPNSVHFHVQNSSEKHPGETEIPQDQITYARRIRVPADIEKLMVSKIKQAISSAGTGPEPLYCEGCRVCMIAIVGR